MDKPAWTQSGIDEPGMSSRIQGFYNLTIADRQEALCERSAIRLDEWRESVGRGGLDIEAADKVVENVVGVYALPFGVTLNIRMNGKDYLAPMVVEEPSVIAAASNAARLIRDAGGFEAEPIGSLMTAQIELSDVDDPPCAARALVEHERELLELASAAVPNLVRRGGGPREIEVRVIGEGSLVVHVHVDCGDAMGANLINTIAEYVGPRIAELAGARLGLRILTNLCDRRRVQVHARVLAASLAPKPARGAPDSGVATKPPSGSDVVDAIVRASRFAEADPYRAATHNKGIMNGIDSVVIATGNDYRAVEAGAHAFAASSGHYRPLATWRRQDDMLVGKLELPLALGIVGGTLAVHRAARMALRLSGVTSASELAQLAAAVGLASNLAALRALATEGIQQGHMALHARSVASAAGARGDEVERVAAKMVSLGSISSNAAATELLRLRTGS